MRQIGVDLPRAFSADDAPERDSGREDACTGIIVMTDAGVPHWMERSEDQWSVGRRDCSGPEGQEGTATS